MLTRFSNLRLETGSFTLSCERNHHTPSVRRSSRSAQAGSPARSDDRGGRSQCSYPSPGSPIADPESRLQIETLESNVAQCDVPYVPLASEGQGIIHVVGPELGMTIVCGDSHTSTHGAFGALAFGIGTSEVEHVLATQTLRQKLAKTLLVEVENTLSAGTTAKEPILYIIGQLGTAGGTGHVIEFWSGDPGPASAGNSDVYGPVLRFSYPARAQNRFAQGTR